MILKHAFKTVPLSHYCWLAVASIATTGVTSWFSKWDTGKTIVGMAGGVVIGVAWLVAIKPTGSKLGNCGE